MRTIESATSERLSVLVRCPEDPTGSGNPEFQATTGQRTSPDDAEWVDGSWAGSWSAITYEVQALTPLLGDGQAVDLTQGATVDLWMRYSDGTDTPVLRLGSWQVL